MTRYDIRTTELDLDLLSTPFEVRTNWHVLTGAACTGKTTLISMLADKGFQVVPESARLYFEKEMAGGRTLEEIQADGAALQRGIEDYIFFQKLHPSRLSVFVFAIEDGA
jgi:predicted ATPase